MDIKQEQSKNTNTETLENIIDKNEKEFTKTYSINDNENMRKIYKNLVHENSKIKKLLKKILKHINYLEKEIKFFKKFAIKNELICKDMDLLTFNFQESLSNLKKERDFLEQKSLDNKIFSNKLIDQIKSKKRK